MWVVLFSRIRVRVVWRGSICSEIYLIDAMRGVTEGNVRQTVRQRVVSTKAEEELDKTYLFLINNASGSDFLYCCA